MPCQYIEYRRRRWTKREKSAKKRSIFAGCITPEALMHTRDGASPPKSFPSAPRRRDIPLAGLFRPNFALQHTCLP